MTFSPGPRFELLGRLGAGATGVVYEARDRVTEQRVALKVLQTPTPRAILAFKREFRSAQLVSHPNLVRLGELHGEAGAWFFTMEFIAGGDLLEYVRPGIDGRRRLDVPRLRTCLTQLTAAVDGLHGAGLLHRDIKPSNIRVADDGRLVLLDFGTAGSGDDDDDRAIVGTAAYMAPEQASSQVLGPPADWYGVGAVLYHALTGRPPFDGEPLEVLVRKQSQVPPSPGSLDPSVPSDLDGLCQALLALDPRHRPTPHAIAGGLHAAPRRHPSASLDGYGAFVGRRPELRTLTEALDRAASATSVVLITGASGVGKSALVQQFASEIVATRDAIVLVARCREDEAIAAGGIDGLVDALARRLRTMRRDEVDVLLPRRAHLLAQAYPVLRMVDAFTRASREDDALVDPFTRRTRVVDALAELLARLADRRRLVVVVDDLQWADAETVAILDRLLAPPRAPTMLAIATWRLREGDPAAPAVLPGARHLPLAPLDQVATEELAAVLCARIGTPGVSVDTTALARESGGHPLLLDALVAHATSGAGPDQTGLTLADALTARYLTFDPLACGVVEAIAVAGVPVEDELLARVLDAPIVQVARATAMLRIQRFLRSSRRGERVLTEPYHDQIRSVVNARIDATRRRQLHAGFANALEAQGNPDPERLLAHLRGAGDDAAAARQAITAAEHASRLFAFHRAAQLYGVAIALATGSPVELRRLRLARADALVAAGRGAEAADDFLACVAGAPPSEQLDLRRQAAQQLLVTGHTAAGLATLREVLAAEHLRFPTTPRRAVMWVGWRRLVLRLRRSRLRPRDPREVAPRDLTRIDVCWHVGLGLSIVDTMRGHAFHVLGILLALDAGEPRRLGRALALDIAYRGVAGGPARAAVEALFVVAHDLARANDDPHALGLAIGCRGVAAFLRGDWADGATWCREAELIFEERCRAVPWELATAKLFGARSMLALGDVAELATRTEAAVRDCRGRGDLYGESSLRTAVLPFLHLFRGDPDAALDETDRALARWSPGGYQIQHYYQLVARCSVALYGGDAPGGLALLDQAEASIRDAMFRRVQLIRATLLDLRGRLHLAAARTAGPDRARHLRDASRCARQLAGERLTWTGALAAVIEAGVAGQRDQPDAAAAHLRAAVAGFDTAAMALHGAAARRRLGTLIGGGVGDRLALDAERWFRDHAIVLPAMVVAMLTG